MPRTIQIVRKPDGRLEPVTGPRDRLKRGESVVFTPGPGAEGLIVEFTGTSPFGDGPGDRKFTYGKEKTIQSDFDESPGATNVYVYVCHADSDNAPPVPGDGGEIEVVRG